MTTALVVVLVVCALLVIAFVAKLVAEHQRRRGLRRDFGGEYDRTVDVSDNRLAAEQELVDRKKRHEQLDIRPLEPQRRQAYRTEWARLQSRFVDAPGRTVGEADALLNEVMSERGYPIGDFERRASDLSVEHADVVEHYREAEAIAADNREGHATSEELRLAILHYRALFASLLGDDEESLAAYASGVPDTAKRSA